MYSSLADRPEAAVRNYRDTIELKRAATRFGEIPSSFKEESNPPRSTPEQANPDLARVLRAHRAGLETAQVRFLQRLSFRIEGTQDDNGVRYVLWRPLVEFIQEEYNFEIEQWLCEGEIAIAYLSHDAARLTDAVLPRIENARLESPFSSRRGTFAVAFSAFCEVELQLSVDERPEAAAAERIRKRVKRRVRGSGFGYSGEEDIRAALTAQIKTLPRWALDACLEFAHQIQPETYTGPMREATASESVLAEDWLRPEEEAAWRNL
jgi:hypothetical protein